MRPSALPLGIPVTLCVPSNASPERITILRCAWCRAHSDRSVSGLGWRDLGGAEDWPQKSLNCYWYANQYDNPANWQAHYVTTGPEILAQTSGEITHLVVGLGTSGTLMGTGRYLREQDAQHIKIVAVQPDARFHGLEGLKHMPTAIKPAIFEPSFADRTMEVRTEAAHDMVRTSGSRGRAVRRNLLRRGDGRGACRSARS